MNEWAREWQKAEGIRLVRSVPSLITDKPPRRLATALAHGPTATTNGLYEMCTGNLNTLARPPVTNGFAFKHSIVPHPTITLTDSPRPVRSSRVDTLSVRIDLHARLRHLGVLQKVQRHPHQMPLDLVELLPDLLRGHERVVEVPLLELVVFREERFVVGKGFDYRGGSG